MMIENETLVAVEGDSCGAKVEHEGVDCGPCTLHVGHDWRCSNAMRRELVRSPAELEKAKARQLADAIDLLEQGLRCFEHANTRAFITDALKKLRPLA